MDNARDNSEAEFVDPTPHVSMYRKILGESYDRLPPLVRDMHEVQSRHTARGRGRVRRGSGLASRLTASLLGMPPEARDIPVETTFSLEQGAETITRNYDGALLVTKQALVPGCETDAGPPALLLEKFGPVALFIRLEGTEEGITFHLQRCSLLGLSLPYFLSPRVSARERVKDGQYHYFVRIDLPMIGRLIEYEGLLRLEKA